MTSLGQPITPNRAFRATIVVPSFNQGRYLPQCLRSLQNQRSIGLETLVFDNESTDESVQVLREFEPFLSKVIIEKDRGQAAALNRGFNESSSEVLGWLNADDMLMPGAVESALRVLDETGADVVYGYCAHLDASGNFIGYFPYSREFDREELQNYNDFIPQPATFFRRSLFERVGPLDETLEYAMDWDLWCRFATAGARFLFVPEVWAGARLHQNAKTSRGGLRRLLEICRVNWRHRTLALPMVPVLYLAYLVNRRLRLPYMSRFRRWWRTRVGGERTVVINGVAPGQLIAGDSARLLYPNNSEIRGLSLDLGDGAYRAAEVRVNGVAMTRTRSAYELKMPELSVMGSVDIQIAGMQRPVPAPFRLIHQADGG